MPTCGIGMNHLIPHAETWGIGDEALRDDVLRAATVEEAIALVETIDPHLHRIDEWLDSFEEGQMTAEAAQFMYLAEAVEELKQGQPAGR